MASSSGRRGGLVRQRWSQRVIRYEPRRNLLTFYRLNSPGSAPFGLALDGQHRLWYTANGADANFLGLLTV